MVTKYVPTLPRAIPRTNRTETSRNALRLPLLASIVPLRQGLQHFFVAYRIRRWLGKIGGVQFGANRAHCYASSRSELDEIDRKCEQEYGCRQRHAGSQKFEWSPER